MSDLPLIDMIAASVIVLALVRGLWIGLVREGLSLAAIGLCTIVVRLFVDPVSVRITELTAGEISGRAALWIAGLLLIMATVLVCGVAARLMRRGVQFAGLGWADRLGGGALGIAEGSILAAVVVLIESWRQEAGLEGELPSVASPGDWLRREQPEP